MSLDTAENCVMLGHMYGGFHHLYRRCDGVPVGHPTSQPPRACSTCHVIFDDETYDNLPEPSEDEDDMLDQAFGLTATSRLGCQVVIEKEHDGIVVTLPKATRNFYVDGHVPKPH